MSSVTSIEKIYPLTPMQYGMIYHWLLDKESNAYFEQICFPLKGELDINLLEKSLNKLVERHQTFRENFLYQNLTKPLKVVFRERYYHINHVTISKLSEYEQQTFLDDFIVNDRNHRFDLSKGHLMRVAVIEKGSGRYEIVWSYHHILMDGWCVGTVMQEWFELYRAELKGINLVLDAVPSYTKYVEWIEKQDNENSLNFWEDYLDGYEKIAEIPCFEKSQEKNKYSLNETRTVINEEITEKLNHVARKYNVTLNTIFQTIWGLILQKYNGADDVVFGAVTSGRPPEIVGIESMVGLFINTIPIRITRGPYDKFSDLLQFIQKNTLECEINSYSPLYEVQTKSRLGPNLINHVLIFENYPENKHLDKLIYAGDLGFAVENISRIEQTNYDFNLIVIPAKDLTIECSYNSEKYSEKTVTKIFEHIIKVIKTILENPDVLLSEIELLTKEEKQLLESFNATGTIYAEEKTIQQLFEEQVERTPEAIAVVSEKEQVSYRELNLRANRLAHVLRAHGVKRDEIIGLMVERTPEMIVGILGILKSGAAYVPLDPAYPEERITYMLADSGAHILLTQDSLEEQVTSLKKNYAGSILDIEQAEAMSDTDENPEPINKSEDLAYVIYTSGSTGKPKGVMLEHRGLINAQLLWENSFGIVPEDRIVQFASSSFDASVSEIFMALFAGAKLYIPSKETILDPQRFVDYIGKNKLTVLTLPPTYLSTIESKQLKGVRLLITAGSAIHPELAERYMQEMNYVNAYGPSEATICATVWIPAVSKIENSVIPIGKPIPNAEVYITDVNGHLQPIGIAGELCIGGAGVGRGYLNRPELTAEKFVENPYRPGERMYRTGDLARWLPDGNIEFLGRIDHQVKIRGYRIEPGEIENQLLKHPKVREAVVIAQLESDGQSQALCAYVVGDSGLKSSILREYLSQELPEYMIPSYFIALEELPLTPNGKVDRKALPKPEAGMASGRAYEAPSNEIESQMAEIWQGVLGREKVGLNDHFFELGGHSLKATVMASAIHKQFDVEIPLKQIFKTPTMRELAAYTAEADRRKYRPIERIAEREWHPVSSAQKRLLILQQLEGGDASYNMPSVFLLEGDLDVACLEQALVKMTERHEALRTSFEWINGEPVQRIHPRVEIKLGYSQASFEEGAELTKSFVRPFDLSKAPLMRAELIQISEEKHLFMLDMHHVVSDGVSMGIFMDELSQMYDGKELGQPRIQYKDYSEWQQARFQSEEMEKQKAYWLEHLGGELPILDLPTDYSRPSVQSFEGNHIFFEADPNLSDGLKNIARETGSTLYMVLLAAYQVLLSRYSGQEDIIVGTPTAGRLHADTEDVLGLFVNTLAVRGCPEGQKTVKSFIEEVKKATLGAYEHQEYPFEELVNQLNIPRDLSRNPLFSTLFVLQNIKQTQLKLGEVQAEPYHMEYQISKFDMSIEAVEQEGRIRFGLEYATRLFREETVGRIAENYIQVLKEFAWNSEKQLGEIKVLTEEEKQLLESFNVAGAIYAEGKTIQQLFEEQVERTPEAIAVVSEKEQLSYRELNLRANRLAHVLRVQGVKRDEIIGLMVERTPEMVVGILGILKSGAAYVPLDPAYPEERITYMLADSGAHILLTQDSLEEQVTSLKKNYAGSILDIEQAEAMSDTDENPEPINKSEDLAYVIYTSGSTGKPKGVMLEHRGLINAQLLWENSFGIVPEDRIVQFASSSFDASVWEIFMALFAGAKLYIPSKETILDSQRFVDYIGKNKLTVLTLPPTYLSTIESKQLKGVRLLITAGSAIHPELAERYMQEMNYVNAYGPSEATICVTVWIPETKKIENSVVPIGKPISNAEVYITDENGELQPIGVAGELCIGGAGVARGYLNQPELTAEKFVENPYRPGERMYRTGDVARWLPDGNIEFLGRIDHQVKIRGYRIEPGEIENQLLKHPKVREAVVIAQLESDGQSQALCAYVVGDSGLKSSMLREYLSQELPEYMIPSYFVALEELPLTPNGKVDRKALPKPEAGMASGRAYEAPSNEIESQMAEIWQGVLGREKVGLNDHFFELGGDSIKGIQVCARLYKHGWKLEMKHLFQYPVLRDACTQVVPLQRKAEQGLIEGEVSLLPIQQWFFEQNLEEAEHWNQAMMLQGKPRFEEKSLEEALRKLVEHHDGLRTVFSGKGQEAKGYNLGVEEGMVNLAVVDLTEEEDPIRAIKEQAEEAQRNFDIEKGPLFRAKVFRTQTEDHLLLVAHHLVIDGVSWRILLEDLAIAYEQVSQGQPVGLQEKTDSVKEWSKGLRNYAISKELLKEVPYWREMEQSTISTLPKDSEPQSEAMKYNGVASIQLSRKDTVLLLEEVNRAYNTEINDLLLTALAQTVQKWTGESAMAVNMEGHGREEIIDSLTVTRTVGWYTSMYPVVLEPTSNADVGMQLKQVKETLRQVPKKGVGYGILRYLTPMEEREGLTFTLKPEISFNYLGQFDADLNTSLFKRSPYETGQTIGEGNQRLYEIDIVGMVDNGRMALNFNYNTGTYRPETMEEIAASYKEQLLILIYHCVNQTVAEVTPSDLGDSSLTLEELQAINSIYMTN
ncbi:amino acid adenylation domain-containing protein [Paenibacillus sp. FSL R5-0744]|uniref:amino acid adenylation domain-containing protein n=1 Tax=Paenibacillus sp. FSL R5-0744 TaxID=2921656 RepID=UPI0030DB398F